MGTIVIVDGRFNLHTIFNVPNESILDEAIKPRNMFESEVWAFSDLTLAPWHAYVVSQKKKKKKRKRK